MREGLGAVVREQGGPVVVEPIIVDDPGPGEVLVRIAASGVCHSDHWAVGNGNWGLPFPMLLGHEGAGTVEAVGDHVRAVSPGDPVLLAWGVPCGACRSCRRGAPRSCSHGWTPPPRVRIAASGEPLAGTLSLGTLATHTVVHEAQALPIRADADLSRLCLLGCGASTGIGAVVNTGKVFAGARVAVIGLGGIGLSAVQAARIAGASTVVAVDLVAAKLAWAGPLGATHLVDASGTDPVEAVRSLTEGVDLAVEATGVPAVVTQAVRMLDRAGVAVAVGVPPRRAEVTLAWSGATGAAYPNKASLLITDGGDALPEDFARWIDWAVDGSLNLDAMVTREATLTADVVTEAFRAMLAGEVIRTVIRPSADVLS